MLVWCGMAPTSPGLKRHELRRWPWITRVFRKQEMVADAAVELVMLAAEGRILRRAPEELIPVMQRLTLGPQNQGEG